MIVRQHALNTLCTVGARTVQNNPPILNESTYNFKCLGSGGPSLIQGQSVQPLQDSLDLIISKHFLHEFLYCVELKNRTS